MTRYTPAGATIQRKPVAGRSCAGKERNNLSLGWRPRQSNQINQRGGW
jgi:hypothetical protein